MFTRPSLIAAAALLSWTPPALAIPIPPPGVCRGESYAVPYKGTTIPANIPAFQLSPNDDFRLPRTIPYHDIQLRDGSGALVPTTIEAARVVGYVVRPGRALAVGEATLSFLEDCPPGQTQRLTTPVRNELFRYTVAPASPFPTRIGNMSARVIEYRWSPEKPDCPNDAIIRFQLETTPEMDAFRSTLQLDLHLDQGNTSGSVPLWPEFMPGAAPNVLESAYECDTYDGFARRKATWNFELTAHLPGADELVIPSLIVPVEVDCRERAAPAGGDAGPPQAAAPDSGADQVHHEGGGCSYVPTRSSGPPLLLILFVLAAAVFRRKRVRSRIR